ncbi:hypothetical protein ES319_A12G021400v1 [Gossypium barbadense]|uniref:Uncharacterized protein n=1 Tax=Gossypium barbadense TaxID=3634 RepID=A0A5J5T583_GOSBA|nr:hypothetical protein ES319_A12G021400v1 [Gossypium barbadense]
MVHPTAAVTPVNLPSSTRARRGSGVVMSWRSARSWGMDARDRDRVWACRRAWEADHGGYSTNCFQNS